LQEASGNSQKLPAICFCTSGDRRKLAASCFHGSGGCRKPVSICQCTSGGSRNVVSGLGLAFMDISNDMLLHSGVISFMKLNENLIAALLLYDC